MIMVTFLVAFVIYDGIPKLTLHFRLKRQRKRLARLHRYVWKQSAPFFLLMLAQFGTEIGRPGGGGGGGGGYEFLECRACAAPK